MRYARKVLLHCPDGYRMALDALVEQFLADGVQFIGVVGTDCEQVEDIIDELIVADGTDPTRYALTSSHPGESVAEAIDFARLISVAGDEEPQRMVLGAQASVPAS